MAWPSRSALVLLLLVLACGQSGSANKIAGMTGDAAAPAPGKEAGAPGRRGGGGAFGGADDPDGAAPDAELPAGDAPVAMADAAPDLSRDRPRDTAFTPVDGVTLVDSAPAFDAADSCAGTCDMIEAEYRAALVRARACNPNLKLQCQMSATTGLVCPGCKVWVTSTVELVVIRQKWNDAGCQTCAKVPCPQLACRPPTTGVCHSKMLAAQDPPNFFLPPAVMGTCVDQTDPVPF